jgi:hypothetical protein
MTLFQRNRNKIIMIDDGTPEELWRRLVEENPRASDAEITRLFIAACLDSEDLLRQVRERVFNVS